MHECIFLAGEEFFENDNIHSRIVLLLIYLFFFFFFSVLLSSTDDASIQVEIKISIITQCGDIHLISTNQFF